MTRKRKDYRELKVSSFSGYGYKSAPMLRIQGLWLEELGFNIGDPILVKCEDGKLIITVDHAREDAETKEQAFLDEEMKKLQKKFEVEKKKIYQQVVAERKVRYPFDYTPTHTVVLYTNHLPKVRATDEGTWRRLIVIPFHAKIEGKSDIKNYSDYLFENAGSYVLAWIIEGARKAIEADFHLERPKVVADAIAEYRGMNDWLEHFLEECCVRGDGLEEKSGELYQEYRSYCLRTGEISRNNADFTAVLEKAGYTRKKKKTGMWVQGLQLKDTDFAE